MCAPLPSSRKLISDTLVNSAPPPAPPPLPSLVPALTAPFLNRLAREKKPTAKQVSQICCDKEQKQAKKIKLAKKPKTADISQIKAVNMS
jgi:hypothetical protein